ncbi:hypothetical protein Fmac_003742 [Flemingia macrophylla]|uniref:Uncharacterized protein n=1 Tax=Flemingia macrophylla TaxID=520843 RepID=A0ABD1N2Z2_9FABA
MSLPTTQGAYDEPAVTGFPVAYPQPQPPLSQPKAHAQAQVDWSTGLCDCFSNFQNWWQGNVEQNRGVAVIPTAPAVEHMSR